MGLALNIIVGALLVVGVAFNTLGAVGLLVFPDVYTRLHAGTKTTTFGAIFLVLAVVAYAVSQWLAWGAADHAVLAVHSLVALASLLVTNPAGAHAVTRAARRRSITPKEATVDAWEPEAEAEAGEDEEVEEEGGVGE